MEWREEYSIGIPEIDEEHKVLLVCIARLEDAKDDKQSDLAVYFVLGELEDYVRVHFTVEEVIMRLFDFPGKEAHIRAHRKFAEYVRSMQKSELQKQTRDEITAFLRDWLVNHIMTADRQYARFLLRQEPNPAQ